MSDDVKRTLRDSYDRRVHDREAWRKPAWEDEKRDAFLGLLRQERKRTVLELGAATGADAEVFAASGLDVVCVDLSPEMVERCRAKGLTAHVMDAAALNFPPESFDAVYAMNCLVHVPKAELPITLAGIDTVLAPTGLFYLGLYGGMDIEGVWDDDYYDPKRFFAHYPNDELQRLVTRVFDLHSFECVEQGWRGLHFQSLILQKRS